VADLPIRIHEETAGDLAIRWRTADAGDGRAPVLYLHGVPDSGALWEPFLARTGGIAPDMPGFGRSAKRADLAYDIPFFGDWLEGFLDHLGLDRVRLVVHDWGAGFGLPWAQRRPDRVERLVVIDPVPLFDDYRWHWLARLWRRRVVGELAVGSLTRPGLRLASRLATPRKGPMPDAWIDRVADDLDQGTQRAILRLYRSADPGVLGAHGANLQEIRAPALVIFGESDPYIAASWATRYSEALHEARALQVQGAGHWPWLDVPGVVDEVVAFLAA
jgi:pimeloyl-ACP methyl ester carboxylesterase